MGLNKFSEEDKGFKKYEKAIAIKTD